MNLPDGGEWADAAGGSPWVLAVLYAVTTIDGFFPPVPSESLVIALAALPRATGRPELWLLGAVAALGAFTGDQLAYTIGRRVPVRRLRIMRSARARTALGWAEEALDRRGAAFLIAARFVPAGRVAVNMAAGAVRFSHRRFSAIAAVSAVLWSAWSVLLGVGRREPCSRHAAPARRGRGGGGRRPPHRCRRRPGAAARRSLAPRPGTRRRHGHGRGHAGTGGGTGTGGRAGPPRRHAVPAPAASSVTSSSAGEAGSFARGVHQPDDAGRERLGPQQAQRVDRLALVEQALPVARRDRVHQQAQLVQQAGREQLAHDRDRPGDQHLAHAGLGGQGAAPRRPGRRGSPRRCASRGPRHRGSRRACGCPRAARRRRRPRRRPAPGRARRPRSCRRSPGRAGARRRPRSPPPPRPPSARRSRGSATPGRSRPRRRAR